MTTYGAEDNNLIGDCVAAACANMQSAWTGVLPPVADVVNLFNDAGGSDTNGIQLETFAREWMSAGLDGYKPADRVQIALDQANVITAVNASGCGVVACMNFDPALQNMTTWDLIPGSSYPDGHAILITGADTTGLKIESGGFQYGMTWALWNAEVTEAHVFAKQGGSIPSTINAAPIWTRAYTWLESYMTSADLPYIAGGAALLMLAGYLIQRYWP